MITDYKGTPVAVAKDTTKEKSRKDSHGQQHMIARAIPVEQVLGKVGTRPLQVETISHPSYVKVKIPQLAIDKIRESQDTWKNTPRGKMQLSQESQCAQDSTRGRSREQTYQTVET